jgi:hypothetical protein
MRYLTYVERNSENLRFYLWFRQYVKRFEALPETEKLLSPTWRFALTREKEKEELANEKKNAVDGVPISSLLQDEM